MNKTIIVNGRFLTQDITGVQKFAWGTCRALADQGFKLIFLCPKAPIKQPEFGVVEQFGKYRGHMWEQVDLVKRLRKNYPTEFLLNLCNTGPLRWKKQVVTIHDMAFKHEPRWFNTKFAMWYNFLVPRLAKRSKVVLTVSDFSKSEIMRFTGIPENRIYTVSNGVYFEEGADTIDFNIPRRFILAVGSDNPRKNYSELTGAFRLLSEKQLKLIIVGRPSHNFKSDGRTMDDNIIWLDSVNDSLLKELYSRAELLVSSSLYEGFGIPVIEALSMNCPVLLKDIPVYRELFSDFASFYSGGKEELAQSLEKELENETGTQVDFNKLGLFSFELTAREVAKIMGKL